MVETRPKAANPSVSLLKDSSMVATDYVIHFDHLSEMMSLLIAGDMSFVLENQKKAAESFLASLQHL